MAVARLCYPVRAVKPPALTPRTADCCLRVAVSAIGRAGKRGAGRLLHTRRPEIGLTRRQRYSVGKDEMDGILEGKRNSINLPAVPPEASQRENEVMDVFSTPEGTCDPLCSVDDMSTADFVEAYKPREDLFKAVSIGTIIIIGALAINHSWVAENQALALSTVFVLGYAGIIFEESLAFNKSGVGLLMAVTLWVIRSLAAPSPEIATMELKEKAAEVSEIVYFLLGAMTIVEIVDAHQGFKLVTDSITTRNPRLLLWVVGFITFFLSSILDNLTSTIVMVSLLRKLVPDVEQRKFLGGVVVIAANAGGAWTPIGDVTTTMLWINGQISTVKTMTDLFIPSAVSLAVPLALMSVFSNDAKSENGALVKVDRPVLSTEQMAPRGRLVFAVGVGALLFVPVFKSLTGLPPYLGMLAGLGTLWLLTDAIHYGEAPERQRLKVPQALSRIDTQGVLFFLGILLSVASLESAGLLKQLAVWLDQTLPSIELVATLIGIASAIIDNVPLVAATMGMYDMATYPQDNEFWQLIAYCAGTGGSILIIGSAAGVAFMGMEKADFLWYMKKVSGYALAGYAAGIAVYLGTSSIFSPRLVVAQLTDQAQDIATVAATDIVATTGPIVGGGLEAGLLSMATSLHNVGLAVVGSHMSEPVLRYWHEGQSALVSMSGGVVNIVSSCMMVVPHLPL